MNELQKNTKSGITDFFNTISSKDSQLNYKKSVPFVHIPNELVCQWDDFFSPDYKWFSEMWTESEFKLLINFDLRFNKLIDSMGELEDVPSILNNDKWKKVMNLASETIGQLRLKSD